MLINISGLRLGINVTYADSTPSTAYANGYSELEWTATSATDEIGENISRNALDLICAEYQSDIERAIWAQIEGRNRG